MHSLVANKNWYQPLSIKKTWICPCSSSIHKTVAFEIQTRDMHTSLPPPPQKKASMIFHIILFSNKKSFKGAFHLHQ